MKSNYNKIIAKSMINVSKHKGLCVIDNDFALSGGYVDQYLLCLHIGQLMRKGYLSIAFNEDIDECDIDYLMKLIKGIEKDLTKETSEKR